MSEALTQQRSTAATASKPLWLVIFAGIAVVCFAVALTTGTIPIELWPLLTGTAEPLQTMVFQDIRGPRVVLAALVGAALAVAGASLQGLFRNPLADPGLIGVSAGAALGAVSYIVLGDAIELPEAMRPYALPAAAIVGALAVTSFLFAYAGFFGAFSIITILLVGIAVNALANVGIGLFQYIGDDRQLRTLVYWTLGSFGRATWITVLPTLVIIAAGTTIILRSATALDRLQLGDAEAYHLGVDVPRVKRRIVLASAAVVGAAVSLSGIVTFIGLVVPHIARLIVGPGHPLLLPSAALIGAALAMLADLLARIVIVPAELPVSLITGALGAPLFLWLIARSGLASR